MIEKCKMFEFLRSFNFFKSFKSRAFLWGVSSRLKSLKPLKILKSPKSAWIMGAGVYLLKSSKLLKSPKTLKLLKSLRLSVAIAPLMFLFGGCVGWGWFVPYSFQPSYHKFKKMCELYPTNYQGDTHSEEYYNKVLALFDTSLDKIDWNHIQNNLIIDHESKIYVYRFKKSLGRIYIASKIYFKDEHATQDNIDDLTFYAIWNDYRAHLEGEGTGFYISSGSVKLCTLFEKR